MKSNEKEIQSSASEKLIQTYSLLQKAQILGTAHMETWAWTLCPLSVAIQARAAAPNPPSSLHPLLCSPSFPSLL